MEYVLSALLLHKLGKEINEESVTNVLKATGTEVVDAKVKALVASLSDVDIQKAVEEAATAPAAAPAASADSNEAKSDEGKEEKKEEKSEEDKAKEAEKAAAGLGSLFG
jgi:large subunit ribosomal protein L12